MPDAGQTTQLINAVQAFGVVQFISVVLACIALLAAYGMWRSQRPLVEANARAIEANAQARKQDADVQLRLISVIEKNTTAIENNARVSEAVETGIRAHNDATVSALKAIQKTGDAQLEQGDRVLKAIEGYRKDVHDGFAAMREEIGKVAPAVAGALSTRLDALERLILAKPASPGPSEVKPAGPEEVKDGRVAGEPRGDRGAEQTAPDHR